MHAVEDRAALAAVVRTGQTGRDRVTALDGIGEIAHRSHVPEASGGDDRLGALAASVRTAVVDEDEVPALRTIHQPLELGRLAGDEVLTVGMLVRRQHALRLPIHGTDHRDVEWPLMRPHDRPGARQLDGDLFVEGSVGDDQARLELGQRLG